MKKILSLFICFQIIAIPVFAEYDFSDEAQAEFDRKLLQIYEPVDFTKKNNSEEIKNSNIDERTNYTPIPLVEEEIRSNTFEPQQRPLFGQVVKVPQGTAFEITFDSGISSGSLEKNDRLAAKLTRDFVYNGVLIAPAGSLIYGTAADAQNAGYAYGSGSLEINFNEILTPDGNMLKVSTENIYMEAKSERAKKMTRDVVIGALGSMLIGAAFTALGGGDDWGRNMAIYGGIGALGGGLRGAMQRGEDIQIPDGTTIELKLSEPLTVSPYMNIAE